MIHRDYHKQGLGQKITEYRLRLMHNKYPHLDHRVETSQHTVGFYESMGFKTEHIIPDGFAKGLDKYEMIRVK